jgi:hypothetical protein
VERGHCRKPCQREVGAGHGRRRVRLERKGRGHLTLEIESLGRNLLLQFFSQRVRSTDPGHWACYI